MIEYNGFKHKYFCKNTPELIKYLKDVDWHNLEGSESSKYIIFLSSDWAQFTNFIDDNKELIFSKNKFFIAENELNEILDKLNCIIPNRDLQIYTLKDKLKKLLIAEKEKNKNLVYVAEAVVYYLIGKKVRRYVTEEMFNLSNEINLLEKKRVAKENVWYNNWIWNENGKKTTLISESELLSPIESFEKNGHDNYKLWEIKGE